ncbi:MAG: hypothetical protein WDM80_08990 [Limisphaerales bacterium]
METNFDQWVRKLNGKLGVPYNRRLGVRGSSHPLNYDADLSLPAADSNAFRIHSDKQQNFHDARKRIAINHLWLCEKVENKIVKRITATKPRPAIARRRCFENIFNDATSSRMINQKNIMASQACQRSRKDKSTNWPTRKRDKTTISKAIKHF